MKLNSLFCSLLFLYSAASFACDSASNDEIRSVKQGNKLKNDFFSFCIAQTDGTVNAREWCQQIMRPNPGSKAKFDCTYSGQGLPHQLIHPNKKKWWNATRAINLIRKLETLPNPIAIDRINNWWRPNSYNGNVGSSAPRHPRGNAVDVKFKTKQDQERAFIELCKLRPKEINAIGFYKNSVLHLGIGDRRKNTWGKSCPKNNTIPETNDVHTHEHSQDYGIWSVWNQPNARQARTMTVTKADNKFNSKFLAIKLTHDGTTLDLTKSMTSFIDKNFCQSSGVKSLIAINPHWEHMQPPSISGANEKIQPFRIWAEGHCQNNTEIRGFDLIIAHKFDPSMGLKESDIDFIAVGPYQAKDYYRQNRGIQK